MTSLNKLYISTNLDLTTLCEAEGQRKANEICSFWARNSTAH